jgi:hypothetical protein
MATIQEVNSSIMFGDFTNTQLDSIIAAVRFARANLAKQAKYTLVKGSRVQFMNNRTGQTMVGDVVEVKRKFMHVRIGMQTWRVPANMLSAA